MQALELNVKLIQLTAMLQDGAYHDGTLLGKQLGVTRSAIWKMIKKLQGYGVPIESVKGKGYILRQALELLNKQLIINEVSKPSLIIEVFESLASTNDYLRAFFTTRTPRICLAETQTKGRGRLQRQWHSPFAENIYFSCLYTFQKDISELAGLSMAVCMAIIKTLQPYCDAPLKAKWPNDVLCEGKKLAGTLIEVQAETNGLSHTIIGIGINVNMLSTAIHDISQSWVSLRELHGAYINRNELCISLINHLFQELNRFEQQGLLSFFEEWRAVDSLLQQVIELQFINQKIVSGQVMGIDAQGHLLLQLPDGTIQGFSAGDVTIRKNLK